MAYISTEKVKRIRKEVKQSFPTYKFSITREHGSSVNIHLLEADFEVENSYDQLNDFYLDRYSKDIQRVFVKIDEIVENVKVNTNSNAGDPTADYPSYNYFKHFTIGKWDRKYKQVGTRIVEKKTSIEDEKVVESFNAIKETYEFLIASKPSFTFEQKMDMLQNMLHSFIKLYNVDENEAIKLFNIL